MASLGAAVVEETRFRLFAFMAQAREALALLSDDELWQRPNEASNSVGNLVLHLCGSTRHFIGRGIGGSDYLRDRKQEFAERGPVPRAELLRVLDDTQAEATSVIAAITDERLLETTDRVGRTPFTVLALLVRVSHHWAVHTGQIVYATKAAHAGAVDELWMKTMEGR